jgi:hypothetical protein
MFKTLIDNIKREIYNIYIDLKDILYSDRTTIIMSLIAFLLGIIVSETYGSIMGV